MKTSGTCIPSSLRGRALRLHDRAKLRRLRSGGQSMVEFALALPILLLMVVGACDVSRAFYVTIQLYNAARAGVQYGAQGKFNAADTYGMWVAATADASAVNGMIVTSSQCTCLSGSGVSSCIGSNYCSADSQSTWVEVDTSAPFKTLIQYPGFPSSFTLSGKAVMQVSS